FLWRSAKAGHPARTWLSEMEPRLKEWPWVAAFAEHCKRVLRLNGRPLLSAVKNRITFWGAEIRGPCKRDLRLPTRSLPFALLGGVEIRGQGGEQDADPRRRVGHSPARQKSHTLLSLRLFFP